MEKYWTRCTWHQLLLRKIQIQIFLNEKYDDAKVVSDRKVADKVHVASTLVTRRSQWTSTSLEASVAKFVTFHGNVNFSPQKCIAPILEMYCVTKHSTDPVFLITSIPLWTLRCCLTQLPLFLAPRQQRGSKIDRLHSNITS